MTLEERLRESLHDPAWGAPPSGLTVDDVVRRARRRDQLLAVGAVVATAAVVAAVVLVVNVVTGGSTRGSKPIGTPSPSVTTGPVVDAPILGVTKDHRYVIQSPDGSRTPVHVRAPQGEFVPLVATSPKGWVVTTEPSSPSHGGPITGLAEVDLNGTVSKVPSEFGGYATALAVSPDGSIALGYVGGHGPLDGAEAFLAVLPPNGRAQQWSLAPSANEIRALAWSSDGRDVDYVAGTQTGAGVWGGIETLELRRTTHRLLPASTGTGGCQFDALANWNGPVMDGMGYCAARGGERPEQVYQLSTGSGMSGSGLTRSPITLRPRGCVDGQLHATPGSPILLATWCGKVYRVDRGRMQLVPGNFVDAAASTARPPGDRTGSVTGTLRIVGGPSPGISRRTGGTVVAHDGSVRGPVVARVVTSTDGRFSLDLHAGEYVLTSDAVGGVNCQSQPFLVHVGLTVRVQVVCPVP